jgi:hypothetical protein
MWGLFLGLFTIINHGIGKGFTHPFLGWAITMLCIFFTWLFFYETRLPILGQKLHLLFTPSAYSFSLEDWDFRKTHGISFLLTRVVLLAICAAVFVLEYLSVRYYQEVYALLRRPAMSAILVFLMVLMGTAYTNAFIYFAF